MQDWKVDWSKTGDVYGEQGLNLAGSQTRYLWRKTLYTIGQTRHVSVQTRHIKCQICHIVQ